MHLQSENCSRCGTPLGRDVGGGVCVSCMLEDALPSAESFAQDLELDQGLVQRFGPYELLEEIGRGGMGVIYKARQVGLQRIVAVKMLLAGEFADAKARSRLLREAKIASRLNHPGIVTIHDVGEHEGRPFFAMEYVAGANLARVCRDGLLSLEKAARYVEELARAVHYAHQHGVIHRDLKPANVLITPDDQPKLTDFGLTKSLIDPTRTIESAGSPNFMAPEQADSSLGPTGTATDVFGLGAILYYVLTGRAPAIGESLAETLRAVVACEPVSPLALRPALPRDLATIALRCLEKDPGRRYSSALEVAEELGCWRNHKPIRARPVTLLERATKWARRRPAVAGLLAAMVVSLIAGLMATTWQWRKASAAAAESRAAALEAQRNAYLTEMTLAGQSAARGVLGDVRISLDRARPKPGQVDLRGWEWRYLWNLGRSEASERIAEREHRIWALAALPDGATVAVGEREGGFSIYDVASGKLVYELSTRINQELTSVDPGANILACRVAPIPGSSLVAFTDSGPQTNGHIRLFDLDRRSIARSLEVASPLQHLAASPDGSRIACTTYPPRQRGCIFDVATGQLLQEFEARIRTNVGQPLAFTPDSRALAVADEPGVLRIVSVDNGKETRRFALEPDLVRSMAFSPDGRWLAAGEGSKIHIYRWPTGEQVKELNVRSALSVSFDHSGKRLLTGWQIWHVPDFELERELEGEWPVTIASVLMQDGKTYLTESMPHSILKWDLSQPKPLRAGKRLSVPAVSVTFLGHREGVMLAGTNGLIYEARLPDLECRPVPELGSGCTALEFAPSRSELVVCREDRRIQIYDRSTLDLVGELPCTRGNITAVHYMPEHQRLFGATPEGWIQLWNLGDRTLASECHVPEWTRNYSALSVRDLTLYSIFEDGRLKGLDLLSRRITERKLDQRHINSICFSRDGAYLTYSIVEGGRILSDGGSLKPIGRFETPFNFFGASFWPKEPRVVFNGAEVYDLATRRLLLRLDTDSDNDPGGFTLVSLEGDMVLQRDFQSPFHTLWWAPTWEEIREREKKVGVHAWW